jgi:hypothetical protein
MKISDVAHSGYMRRIIRETVAELSNISEGKEEKLVST